jgi:hypothetical protein
VDSRSPCGPGDREGRVLQIPPPRAQRQRRRRTHYAFLVKPCSRRSSPCAAPRAHLRAGRRSRWRDGCLTQIRPRRSRRGLSLPPLQPSQTGTHRSERAAAPWFAERTLSRNCPTFAVVYSTACVPTGAGSRSLQDPEVTPWAVRPNLDALGVPKGPLHCLRRRSTRGGPIWHRCHKR